MKLHWLPVQGYRSPFQGLGPFFAHIALPTLTLSVIFIALIARMTRASAIEVLQEDYVRTAYAKGQNELVILVRHVLANCAVPIVRSEEHTSELQSLMRISYAVFCLKKKKTTCHIQRSQLPHISQRPKQQITNT